MKLGDYFRRNLCARYTTNRNALLRNLTSERSRIKQANNVDPEFPTSCVATLRNFAIALKLLKQFFYDKNLRKKA